MDKEVLKEIDRYYTAAKLIAGDVGNDLLHHVLLNFDNKRNLKGEDLFKYLYKTMQNEYRNKRSPFNKDYTLNAECGFDDDRHNEYDGIQVLDILEQLKLEGHEHKVNLFLDVLYKKTTVKRIAEEMNVSRMYVYRNYITFVKNQIKERYEHI